MRLLCLKLKKIENWRKALIYSVSCFACLLLSVTEILSYFDSLKTLGIQIAWGTIAIIFLVIVIQKKMIIGLVPFEISQSSIRGVFKANVNWELGFIALVLVVTAVLSWVSPPNTFDSMTYHMSRVMHWMQNQ